MIHTHVRFSQAIDETVTGIEKKTDAELIVVAAERSGSYRDLAYVAASVSSLFILAGLVYMPWTVHPWFLLLDLAVLWPLLAWLYNGRHFIRLFSSSARRARQVNLMANAEFHGEGVHATPSRTGLLIYVSALEGTVKLLPDVGLQGRIRV